MTRPNLFHRIVEPESGTATRLLLILHGILGQGRNWHALAKALVSRHPEWAVGLVDLRMHGRSQGFSPPHTVAACAGDVLELAGTLPLPVRAVAGHSFGGKVALTLAGHAPEGLDQVFVLDANPAAGKAATRVGMLLELLRSIPMPQPSRNALVSELQARGLDLRTAQWVATNARPAGRVFEWAVDLDAIEAMLRDFLQQDFMDLVASPDRRVAVRFVAAAESPVLPPEMIARLRSLEGSARVSVDVLPRAGHWLHADNPQGLLEILSKYL